FTPFVDKTDDENCKKYAHGDEPEHAHGVERDGPRKQKRDLEIEDDEQDRDEVIANVEPHARVFERVEAALVGRKLGRVLAAAAESETEKEKNDAQCAGDDQEDRYRCVISQHILSVQRGRH